MSYYAALTHTGNKREQNEDALGCDAQQALYLVADGMGGHAAGEVASELVSSTILEHFSAGQNLTEAILAAHHAIAEAAHLNPTQAGMGSTVVALHLVDNPAQAQAQIAWVGDSRAYLFRAGTLERLTTDHSYTEGLVASRQISREQARTHPQRNVITQVLGVGLPVPQQIVVALQVGDWILLCSDGLNDELDDATIVGVMRRYRDATRACQALIDKVCSQEAKDNVSVIIVGYGEGADQGEELEAEISRPGQSVRKWPRIAIACAAILAAAIATVLILASR